MDSVMPGQLDRIESEFREHREETKESFEKIQKLLTGNGTPEKGIIVRLDRMEQAFKAQLKWRWAIIITLMAGVGNLLAEWFHKFL